MFKFEYVIKSIGPIIACLPTTLTLTLWAICIALVLGIGLSVGVKSRNTVVSSLFAILNSFLKGIPILVFLYIFNTSVDDIMLFLGDVFHFTYNIRKPPTFWFAVAAMALSYAPYMCDMIITSMDTIPKGQWEACMAGGFTKAQTLKRIIIPQCIVIAIPNFGNHFVNLLKASSLACMVTIMEMMGASRNFATLTQRFLESYVVCALIYWIVFIIFEQIFVRLERRFGRYLKAGVPVKRKKRFLFISEQKEGSLERGNV